MPTTRDLLARMRGLEDLLEVVGALGYAPRGEDLNRDAWSRLGLGAPQLGVRRAAVLARHGTLTVYGLVAASPARDVIRETAGRLARATAGTQALLLALDAAMTTLICAMAPAERSAGAGRQFRIPLHAPSAVALEILTGLGPRPGDGAMRLACRIADTLAEEGLSARFFRDFRRLHQHAAEALGGMRGATRDDRRDLALIVLTRVLFLYFIQAKGWLDGRSDFLPSALDTALGRGHPFHRTVYEPLCFGALNTPGTRRRADARALGDLPFLNGGLFERSALERRFPDADLPDGVWRDLFDGLFERYHFTVREDGDGDAVDPEMLGRVFEGLMAAPERRASGTFFTPRPLVRDVVHHAIEAAVREKGTGGLSSLRVLDPAVGSGAFLLEALHQLEVACGPPTPGQSVAARRRAIVRDNLFGVDVDPMAVRLAELRLWLAIVVDERAAASDVAPLPNLDWNVRQGDSLVSPLDADGPSGRPRRRAWSAVAEQKARYFTATGGEKAAIARTLRADERRIALAVLDAELTGLADRLADAAAASGRDLFGTRHARSRGLARRTAVWRQRRRELTAVRRRLTDEDAVPFFAWDVHFGDAVAGGGFDVVVGNPPWVRGEALPLSRRVALARRYSTWRAGTGRSGFAHLPDLSVAFVERGLELLRPGGVMAFVLPAKLLRSGYASGLRALLRRDATILHVEDRSHADGDGFAATVFPMTLVCRRGPSRADEPVRVRILGARGRALEGLAAQHDLAVDQTVPGAPWPALPGDLVRALRRGLAAGPCLRERFRPTLGVKTGANEVFLRPRDQADTLPASCRAAALMGRDVAPFRAEPSAVLLAAIDERGRPLPDVPADVRAYLTEHAGAVRRRVDARDPRLPPWAIFRTDLLRSEWVVLWRDIAPRLEATVLHRNGARTPIPLNTCYGIAVPDGDTAAWLAALLNSRVVGVMAAAIAERASGGVFRFSAATVGALPLPPEPHDAAVRDLHRIARTALDGGPYDPDHLDDLAARALRLDTDTTERLRFLDDALRRDTGRDR